MGRDDARPVGGLAGGTAPARAFRDFMVRAVANRPVEQFETQVPMPNWDLGPDEQFMDEEFFDPGSAPMVDEDGFPIYPAPGPMPGGDPQPLPAPQPPQPQGGLSQQWLDGVLGTGRQQPQPPPERRPPAAGQQPARPAPPPATPPRPPQPRSAPDPNAPQPRPDAPQ